MPRYAITEQAGRFVAGQNNTGVGTVLTLTEKQAEHELRLGTLRALNAIGSKSEAASDSAPSLPANAETKPIGRGKTRGNATEQQGG
ncbi:hypothetical protein MCRY_20935 [Marivita cryptomonadis]|jgi:hypothetical protein|uniref:hypothetical protein n=1 Tax=Marivita cryptomonadis TaxID=505252 RepID=UPI000A1F9AA3|nr:hypothetical protein [Marivita cryptomonadis]OSQ54954.1 hypothetical protein MCRY_20935 [Marivita cryptomonadis]